MVLVQNKIDLLHESQIDRLVYFDFTNFNYIQTRLVGYRPHIFVSCHWKSREFSIAFLHAISWGNSCEVSISNEILPFKLNWYYFRKMYLHICFQRYVHLFWPRALERGPRNDQYVFFKHFIRSLPNLKHVICRVKSHHNGFRTSLKRIENKIR